MARPARPTNRAAAAAQPLGAATSTCHSYTARRGRNRRCGAHTENAATFSPGGVAARKPASVSAAVAPRGVQTMSTTASSLERGRADRQRQPQSQTGLRPHPVRETQLQAGAHQGALQGAGRVEV